MKKILLSFLAITLFATTLHAADAVNKSIWSSVAIEGYDPVAYFIEKKPIKGKKEFTLNIKDGKHKAKWRFSSNKNLLLFKTNPDKYAPQYGGYCAYAVSQNSTAGIDPDAWTIVKEKLYLNYNKEIQDKWLKNQSDFIKKADLNWPQLLK